MSPLSLLIVCLSAILGVSSVATIFVTGWVKSSNLTNLETDIAANKRDSDAKIHELKLDIDKLWDKVSKIEVLNTKLEAIEKSVTRIEEAVNRIGK